MSDVYLNGEYLPKDTATISIEDRGFLFADGIYEVIRVYGGTPFEMERHLRRLARSATLLHLAPIPDAAVLAEICTTLLQRNAHRDASLYIQVTRGVAVRAHAFPTTVVQPTVLVMTSPAASPRADLLASGATAITVPDDRWARCDIKTIGLTANVLAKQRAVEAGALEAVFVRDGTITDCASCNVFAVKDGVLWTAPKSNYILAGVTRDVVIELAREAGIPVREEPFRLEALYAADEVFITATTTEVMPIVQVDSFTIGSGTPGRISRQLVDLFADRTRSASAG